MSQLPLDQAIPRFKENEERIDKFVNGTDLEVWTPEVGAPLPTIAKFLKDKEAEIDLANTGIMAEAIAAKEAAELAATNAATQVTLATAAKDAALQAETNAEAAEASASASAASASAAAQTEITNRIASQEEAEAGVNNTELMTPLRTKQQVDISVEEAVDTAIGPAVDSVVATALVPINSSLALLTLKHGVTYWDLAKTLVGNGTTNDTAAFLAALNAAKLAGIKLIISSNPNHKYKIIEAEIPGSFEFYMYGASFVADYNTLYANTCATIMKTSTEGNHYDITIRDAVIDGQSTGSQNASGAGNRPLLFFKGGNIELDKCIVQKGANRGSFSGTTYMDGLQGEVQFNNPREVYIHDCIFQHSPGEQIYILSDKSSAVQQPLVRIERCKFIKERQDQAGEYWSSSSVVIYKPSKTSYITDCDFETHIKSAINWFGAGLVQNCRFHGVKDSQAIDFDEAGAFGIDQIVVRGCSIHNVLGGYPIRISGRNVIVEDCDINRCQNGIYIETQGTTDAMFTGVGVTSPRNLYNVFLKNITGNGNEVPGAEAEVLQNASFGATGGWTVPSPWAISGGQATRTGGSAGNMYADVSGIAAGETATLSVAIASSSHALKMAFYDAAGVALGVETAFFTGAGTFEEEVIVPANAARLYFIASTSSLSCVLDWASCISRKTVTNTFIKILGLSSTAPAVVHVEGVGNHQHTTGGNFPSANEEYGIDAENCYLFLKGALSHGATSLVRMKGYAKFKAQDCRFFLQNAMNLLTFDGATIRDAVFEDCETTESSWTGKHVVNLNTPTWSGRLYRNRAGDIDTTDTGIPFTTNYTTTGTT
ncbi:pectin lyase fold domain-containing protein [Rhizobium phage RHph_X3_15]|nr:pectin lyase fold domain-containing protein [Rhizobium phage RHph_X3_15]